MRKYASVNFSDVQVQGKFWAERLETVLEKTIPSQHKMLKKWDILDSVKLPKPVPELTQPRASNGFTVQVFWDSDVGKWIEAASFALSHRRDEKIEAQIESIIDDLEKAQAEDGYLNCWYLQREPENRWTNLRDNHELYNAGHLMEGAVAYFYATGRDRLLNIMSKFTDHIAKTFGPNEGQLRGYPGHQEIEMALVKAFHATKDRKFLDLATYFIDERGNTDGVDHYFDIEAYARGDDPKNYWFKDYEYSQAHLPVREQTKVVGHAVRAMYMYAAMADLAAEHDDAAMRKACETLWKDVTQTRMYVTGGFGPSEHNEGFTKDYDLPNDTSYAETCASVAMIFWAARMLNLDLDGQYADIMELALFNNTLAGLSRDGEHYFYDNKLDSDGSHHRWEWHACPCCTMNVARLVASVAGYFYGVGENEIALHLYGGTQTSLAVAGTNVGIKEVSNYPWDGKIEVNVTPERASEFTLSLRIPAWSEGATCTVNGETVDVGAKTERGYLKIKRTWQAGDKVELNLPMPPRRLYAHPDVKPDSGRVAIARGPLVYCAEQADNGDLPIDRYRLGADSELAVKWRDDLFDGASTIVAQAEAVQDDFGTTLYRSTPPRREATTLTAIPYYLWCNRGSNQMQVWINE